MLIAGSNSRKRTAKKRKRRSINEMVQYLGHVVPSNNRESKR